MLDNKYLSQSCQDEFIDKVIFKGKSNGVFLDIGAYDGVTFSNTYFFEKSRQWKGVCVEPIPTTFDKLKKSRSCNLVNACVSDVKGTLKFIWVDGRSEMLSGLVDEYNTEHMMRIDREIQQYGGQKRELDVQSRTVNDILEEYKLYHEDYCNIDVEGSELKIIKSIDFSKFKICSFTVENNYKDTQLTDFMLDSGYELVAKLGADEVYILKDYFRDLKIPNYLANFYKYKAKFKEKFNF